MKKLLLVCALVLSLALVAQAQYTEADLYGTWFDSCKFAFSQTADFYTVATFDWVSPDSYSIVIDTYLISVPGSCSGSACCVSENLALTLTLEGTYEIDNVTLIFHDSSRRVTFQSATAAVLASIPPFDACVPSGVTITAGSTVDITNSTGCGFLQLPYCPDGISVYIYTITDELFTLQGRSSLCVSNSTSQTTAHKEGGGGSAGALVSWASFAHQKLEDVFKKAVY